MRTVFLAVAVGSLSACAGPYTEPPASIPADFTLARLPCDGAVVGVILAQQGALSRAQRQYVGRCGVKFSANESRG